MRIDKRVLEGARRRPIESLGAYKCWLRGIDCLRHGARPAAGEARSFFQRAIEIDPAYARGYSGLSLTHFNEWSCLLWEQWEEKHRAAFDYAECAARLDDTDHVVHCVLGKILLYRREFDPAERHLERALALNHSDTDILVQIGVGLAHLGRAEEGVEVGETAFRLDPFHEAWYPAFVAMPFFHAGRLEQAITFGERAPDAATEIRAYLASAYAHLDNVEKAREHFLGYLVFYRQNITFGRLSTPQEPFD